MSILVKELKEEDFIKKYVNNAGETGKDLMEYVNVCKKNNIRFVYVLFDIKQIKFIVTYNPALSFKYIVAVIWDIEKKKVRHYYDFSLEYADIEFDYYRLEVES